VDIDTGEIVKEPKSHGRYTKEEMRLFLDEVIQWASELGCHFPVPEDLR